MLRRPARLRAGAWDSYVLRYTAGARPLSPGAVLRVQLPDSWHAWRRNGAKGVQDHDPRADNHVTAHVVAGHAEISCQVEGGVTDEVVKSNRVGIDGREGRYVFVVAIRVIRGSLQPGDVVDVVYGDRSAGSRGFAAALNPQGPETVTVAVDPDGSGHDLLLPPGHSPVLDVAPNAPVEVVAYAPSLLGRGERADLRIVVLDAEGNRVDLELPAPRIEVRFSTADADIDQVQPSEVGGELLAGYVPTRTGVLRLEVQIDGLPPVLSNPMWISADPPLKRLYWGDLHSHADHSFDGIGRYPYEYARDVSCLDFYALTEHCERWSPGQWDHLVEQVTRFHKDGSFVVFLAYEGTFHEPWGHHNVYFRDPEDAVVVGAHTGTLLDLWAALRGRRALTIPHHTGVAFSPKTAGSIPGSTSPAVDWSHHDPALRRSVEIYSGHGQSEYYDPAFDLSYENSDFSMNTSRRGPHYARDAWTRGHHLGVIASSDNHRAQPGRGELGLAAVYAATLERGEVFDALHDSASYGTTGARIVMDFSVNDQPMGSRIETPPDGLLRLSVRVSGSAQLQTVEIITGDVGRRDSFRCARRWDTDQLDLDVTWTDPQPVTSGTRVYYARVRQHAPYRGRRPTAWSSPVWVTSSRPQPVEPS